MTYLEIHPPASPQYRWPRREQISGIVFVHTAESIMDTVGPDTGAENVAGFIARRSDPGSYHELVDSDSYVVLVADDAEAFQVAAGGHNRHGWGISFACSAADLDPDAPWTRHAIDIAGTRIRAFWTRCGINPTAAARYLTQADAAARRGPGLCTHGDVQPGDRTDAWTTHPRRAELEQMLIDAITPTPISGGSRHMLDVTVPEAGPLAGHAVEFRCVMGGLVHRWQTDPGGVWNDYQNLGAPPTPVDSVRSFSNGDGRLEVLCWLASDPGRVWRRWQGAAGGMWSDWATA